MRNDIIQRRLWKYSLYLLVLCVTCTVVFADQVIIENAKDTKVISKDEELIQKPIGPSKKYELLNSFPSIFSTNKKKREENLVQIYDTNLLKQFPFLTSKDGNSITLYRPFPISTTIIGAEESLITIPPVEPSLINENADHDLNLGCSSLNDQTDYVISESMLNSGSFGHVWMARNVHDQSLYILKRIRIEKGLEALFAARREIFLGSLLRGTEGIAKYEECFIQDIGLLMNSSPSLPDRIISIPWLAFKYEGVSLSQLLYSPNACQEARETDETAVINKNNEGVNFIQKMMKRWRLANWHDGDDNPDLSLNCKKDDSQQPNSVLVQPSEFWKLLRDDDILYKVIVYKICLILKRLHHMGIIHRDIKPENILVSHIRMHNSIIDYKALTINFIDFGSSIFPPVSSLYPIAPSMDECTKLYAPPEAETNSFTLSYDIWSLGITMLEMIFGHKQFLDCESRMYAKLKHQYGDLAEKKCYSNTLRSYCASSFEGTIVVEDCIEKVMMRTIQKRDMYYNNKGETNLQKLDLIRRMLVIDPQKRITIDQILKHPYFKDMDSII